jgi:outer membrane autotransporter protein
VHTGYTGTNANLTGDGRVLVNGGNLGVYGTYFTGGYYADAAVTGGLKNYSTKRTGLEGDAFGSTQGANLDVLVDTGYDWRVDALTIGPTASFQYSYAGIDGYTEHGSLAPLRYAGQHIQSIRSSFGLRVAYDWKFGGVVVRPEASLGWQHEYGDRSYSIESGLASGAGSLFSVSDTQIGRDSLLFGGGVAVLWNPRTSTYLYYDADLLKKEYNSQSVSGGLRMNF